MKTFSIDFCYSVHEATKIKAKNEKEAVKKFRETRPDERILSVCEVDMRIHDNDF